MRAAGTERERVRVFLAADAPSHLSLLHRVRSTLAATDVPGFEPILLPPQPEQGEASQDSGPALREGDLLVCFLTRLEGSDGEAISRLLTKARHRRLQVIRWLADDSRPSLSWRPVEGNPLEGVKTFRPADEVDALAPLITAKILERRAFADPASGLFLRWSTDSKNGPADPDAAPTLSPERRRTKSPFETRMAREFREQAMESLRARMLGPAQRALQQAADHEPDSALTTFWQARVLAAIGTSEELQLALTTALEAAQLARVERPRGHLELAAWWLVARLAAHLGESPTLIRALVEVELSEQGSETEWVRARHLLQETGLPETPEWLLQCGFPLDKLEGPQMPLLHTFFFAPEPPPVDASNPERPLWPRLKAAEERLRERCPLAAEGSEALSSDPTESSSEIGPRLLWQLGLLSRWAEKTVRDAWRWKRLQTQRESLERMDEGVPDPAPWEHFMERVWPQFGEKRDDLAHALREADREIRRLQKQETSLRKSLEKNLKGFAEAVIDLEDLLREDAALAAHITAEDSTLRWISLNELATQKLPADPELLPSPLSPMVASTPPAPDVPALWRLEETTPGKLVASRAGVYFHAVYAQAVAVSKSV